MLPRLGSLQLREITPSIVTRFRLELEAEGVGRVSIHKSMTLLQGVLQRACEWDRLASKPACAGRKPTAAQARSVEPLTPDAVEAIRFWLVEREDLAEWRLRGGRPPDRALVFPGHDGGPWSPAAYENWHRRIFRPAIAAVGLTGARPYDLRHSSVSLLIAEGHNVVEVARQAGHSPKMALDTYAHVFEEIQEIRPARPASNCASGRASRPSSTLPDGCMRAAV